MMTVGTRPFAECRCIDPGKGSSSNNMPFMRFRNTREIRILFMINFMMVENSCTKHFMHQNSIEFLGVKSMA